MTQQKSDGIRVTLKGAFMSVLLIVSFLLPRIWENNSIVSSLNTVLIVVILLLSTGVVRSTAALFEQKKAKLIAFSLLFLYPVLNIAVVCFQFVFADTVNPVADWFTAVLVLLSVPVFCCLYFSAVCVFHRRYKPLIVTTAFLDSFGIVYVIVRLADKVIVDSAAGGVLSAVSPWFSFAIYIISLACFIICAHSFRCTEEC